MAIGVAVLMTLWAMFVGAQESRGPQAAIPGVIAAGARVEEVRGGFKGLEGPVAAPDGGLFFSDIPASITYKLEPNGAINVWRENTGGANGLFLARDGRLLAAEGMGRRIVAVTPDKRVTPIRRRDPRPTWRRKNQATSTT
jgi:gluconolactonase